ncbi:MAG TPA: antibiotic biosynthesis monooxygenase [Chitinophagaceae bacterium]|nr:antibiotic biosynthesis monooxygenase [Chitinophagaceae bacterium]
MIAVIFEGIVENTRKQEYLEMSTRLQPLIDKMEGFISVERFQSLADPEKVLSLSFWKNEESIAQMRDLEMHRLAELKGREYIFIDYRIRIAIVGRDYGRFDRKDAPVN